jgi:acyl-CoA thioester hydrolase
MTRTLPHDEVTTRVRVRYADTDRMGVVYYANYLVWFEIGRSEWLRAQGVSYRDIETGGVVLPVIDARCTYRAPVRYDEEVEIRTRGALLSAVRVEFRYVVVRPHDRVVAAEGVTVHAATDLAGRPKRLPASIRSLFR